MTARPLLKRAAALMLQAVIVAIALFIVLLAFLEN
jgi:hypothetical protein